MDTARKNKLQDLFNYIDDTLNVFIDKFEITPIHIGRSLYVTGLKRASTSVLYNDIDAHVKEIRTLKLPFVDSRVTDEGGVYMLEPDGEVWMDCEALSQDAIDTIIEKFEECIKSLDTMHIMISKWKVDKDTHSHIEIGMYENKRVAYKEAVAMRKKYTNVTNKFEMYNAQGDLIEKNVKKEPTDLELICAASTSDNSSQKMS